jgi:hypothetical protein
VSRLPILTACTLSLVASLCPLMAYAQEKKAAKEIRFNHLETTGDRAYELNLSNGEPFNVVIEQTCEPVFAYEVRGIYRSEEPTEQPSVAAGGPLTTKTLTIVHDDQYGGYIVSLTRTAAGKPCVNSDGLQSRTLIISTRKLDWDLAFSGGFTVTSLTNPVFFVRPHPTVTGQSQVQEDVEARDDANLGIGTFVHIYHHRLPWLAGVFGLGIREGNRTEYFLGGGIRFNDKATLNLGYALGPVERLPNGVNTTDPVSDPNVLNNLSTRNRGGVFVGITYSFINVRQKLEQPFAGSETQGQESANAPADTRAACTVSLDPQELDVEAEGGTSEVQVTPTNDTCTWAVGAEAAWAPVSTPGGRVGSQKVSIAVEANPGPRREHRLQIGGEELVIKQAGAE